MKICENGKYRDMTEAELTAMEAEQKMYEVRERHRPLTESEVNVLILKKQINTVDIDDATAVRMISYYPTFHEIIGQTVELGFKFSYKGKLYKVIQATLTIQEQFAPGVGTESLYERIDEVHDGDFYDPIPYEGNMALENGKYYIQSNVLYLCIRDSGNAVYNPLSDLVGLYVEVAI